MRRCLYRHKVSTVTFGNDRLGSDPRSTSICSTVCARQAGRVEVYRSARGARLRLEGRRLSAHLAGVSTALKIPPRMTVAEFLTWEPPDHWQGLWQLRVAEPEMMAPASDAHGSIQSRLSQLIGMHLDTCGGHCRIVTAPGVVPAERSEDNCLVPDLGITCSPPTGEHLMHQPLVLIEILSPTNVSRTRENIRAYRTIPGVQEIVLLHSSAIVVEILRRGADGTWPQQPDVVDAGGELRLDSISFVAPLRDAYRTSGLT